jgi:hypothetical protein
MRIQPGEMLEGGYAFSVPGPNSTAFDQILAASVTIPVSCSWTGTTVGWIVVNLASGPYVVLARSNKWIPAGDATNPSSYQGATLAPDLCNGQTMYSNGANFSAEVNSTDTTDNVEVEFHYQNVTSGRTVDWSSTQTVTPVSTTFVGSTVGLSGTWAMSSWNPANWSGFTAPTSTVGTPSGSAWNGSAWNGSAWNGSAWNGSAWNGSAWNGSAWNGSAWNGSAWNGSAWNGSAWNGSAWNGSAWNGSAWNGSAWNGSAWNGSAWNGSAWNGSSWN